MRHPKTGESVRVESVCENNPPNYDHDWQTTSNSWAEFVSTCTKCGEMLIGGVR